MSKTVDERVVSMQFDNQQFERNVKTSMSTLDKLKQSLNFKDSAKGLESINAAAKNTNLSGLSAGVETVRAKFSALQVMGVTTLANITNTAVNAGKKIVSALTIDPIKTGFSEYETKINSIQTIMSNTASKGTTMEDVTRVINDLNTYADKTIYNFSEMTRNIGTFTAAGVGLEKSASAIKGIANLAAASGSNSQQASTAMYQLSQALAAGTVKLQDWNSVVNAGMGGEKFQEALKATAREHGVAIDKIIKKQGSFRESLKTGWMTADILNETLNKFTVDGAKKYAKSMVESGKWTKKQADALVKEARSMEDAATKVKTFTQLWDTLKEAAQSGWGQTWELIIGDFEEAKELFSEISEVLGGLIDKSADSRNKVVKGWKDLGGRKAIIDALRNSFEGIISVVTPIKEAFREIFPPITAKQLASFSKNLRDLTAKFKLNKEQSEQLKSTFKGLFAVIDLVTTITGGAFKIAFKVVASIIGAFDLSLLDVTALIGDAAVKFRDWTDSVLDFTKLFKKIGPYLRYVGDGIRDWASSLKETDNIPGYIITGLLNGLKNGGKLLWDGAVALGKSLLDGIKNILGIHSPSVAFFEVGQNIILGLANGIKNGTSIVWSTVKELGTKAIEAIKNIDWSSVFAGLISLGMVATVMKIANALDDLVSPIRGLGDVLSGAGKILDESAKGIGKSFIGLSKVLKSFAFSIKAKAIKNIAISIAILVGCVIALALMDSDKVWGAVAILSALIGVFTAMIAVVEVLSMMSSKLGAGAINFGALSASILGIGAAMLLMGITLKIIGSINPDQFQQAIDGMVSVIASLITLVAAYGLLVKGKAAKNADQLGKMLRKIAVAMLLMAVVMKILGGMKPEEMIQGGIAIAGFVGVIALLTLITRLSGDNFDKLGNTLMKMSAAMLIMAAVVRVLGGMDPTVLGRGLAAINIFVLIVGALTVISVLGSNSFGNLGKTLMSMSVSMLLMAAVVKLLGEMDPAEMTKGYSAILVFVGVIALLTSVVKMLGKDAPKMAATILAMSTSIAILAGVAILLSLIDLAGLAKGVIAIGILGSVMESMIYATKDANDCKGNLIVMTVAIGIMAAAVAALSMIDPTSLAGAVAALSIVTGMFALMTKAASNVKSAIGPLIMMVVAVGLIGGLLYLLAGLPIQATLTSAVSLSVVLLAMSASLLLISKVGPSAIIGIVYLGAITAVIALLGFVLAMMSDLNTQSAISNAIALSVLLGVMTVALLLLQAVGPTALVGAVSLAALTVVVAMMGLVLAMMTALDTQSAISNAIALSILLGVMTASLVVLSAVGAMGPSAFVGIAALATMITGVGGLIVGIGALVQKFPALESFLDTGIPILEKIGHALGSFLGNIVGGFIEGATSILPQFGTTLSQFITNLTPFISGAKSIDQSVIDNVKSLADVIMIITGASLLESITSFLTGGSSITQFAAELPVLGNGLKAFSDSIAGINSGNITAAANAAKALAEMADTMPNEGGMVAWFTGENSMSKFSGELPVLGSGLKEFSDSVNGINAENLTAAANAGKTLAEMCSEIPNSEGVAAWFAGDNSISKFGDELPILGNGLKCFSDSVKGLNTESMSAAVEAAKKITEMADTIPNSEGVAAWFAGDNSISKFGEELPILGKGLKGFSDAIVGISPTDVTAAAEAAKKIAEMTDSIPNSDGIVSWFTGDNSISDFADELPKLGRGIKGFSNSLDGINPTNVIAGANAAKTLAEMTKNAPGDPSKLINFGEKLSSFGDSIRSYFNKVSVISSGSISASSRAVTGIINSIQNIDPSKISQAASAIDKLSNSLKNASDISSKSITGFSSSLKNIGDAGVDSLLKSFSNAEPKMKKAGETMIDKVVAGAKSKSDIAKKAFQNVVSDCTKDISTDDFKDIGKYVVKGFANGISENTWRAEAKAAAMAEAAKEAAKEELDEHSPSKEFYKIGDFAGLGFVNALGDYITKSYNAGYEMAKSAKEGIGKSIAKVASIVDSDIDSRPTIRPVLDLSSVSDGVSAIDGMFDMRPSVGVMANLRSISASMNDRQNGNNVVVSAIDDLKKTLSNTPVGNTYNINGITYDDGSSISNAVEQLVRAARVERRV